MFIQGCVKSGYSGAIGGVTFSSCTFTNTNKGINAYGGVGISSIYSRFTVDRGMYLSGGYLINPNFNNCAVERG